MSVTLRERKLPSGKIQLYLDIYFKGKRQTEALNQYLTSDRRKNQEIRRLAEAIRAKRELQLHGEAEGLIPTTRIKMNFFLFAETVYGNKKEITKSTYINALEYLKELAGNELTFEKLTSTLCERYMNHLQVELKQNTAAAYFARFKTVLKKALKEGIIVHNPADDLSIRTVESLPKYLTEEELIALAQKPCGNNVIRDAFFFSCFSGMRFGDISRLTWEQIKDDKITLTQGKTKVSQIIYLSDGAKKILKELEEKVEPAKGIIFPFPRRSTVDKVLKSWAKRAELKTPLSFHKARHTFATLMLTSGNDIYTTKNILGHKSLATTQIYAKVIDEKQKEAMKKLPTLGI